MPGSKRICVNPGVLEVSVGKFLFSVAINAKHNTVERGSTV